MHDEEDALPSRKSLQPRRKLAVVFESIIRGPLLCWLHIGGRGPIDTVAIEGIVDPDAFEEFFHHVLISKSPSFTAPPEKR